MRKNLLLILVIFLSAAFCLAMESPQELKCEGEVDPEGIDTPEPTFSWEPDPESEQSAWQVIVSDDYELIESGVGNIWDSGKVYSEDEYCIYGSTGPSAGELLSNNYYSWAVRTWDEQDNHSEYAEYAEFKMNHFIFLKSFDYEDEIDPKNHSAGDINNNGYIDIVIAREERETVDIYFNNKDGSFELNQQIEGTYSRAACLADLNNNGWLDLIVANEIGGNDNINVYYNDGSGGFEFADEVGIADTGSRALAAGDLNRNGLMDFVEGVDGDRNRVFINDGQGGFNRKDLGDVTDNTESVVLADLNGNSYLDIIVGNYQEPNRVYLNDGTGDFSEVEIEDEINGNTKEIALIDLHGDGHWDFVSANAHTDGIRNAYYLNDGSGNFKLEANSIIEDDSFSISSADINGDGMMEYAVGNENTGNMRNRIYEYDGFLPFVLYRNNFYANIETRSILLHDFTGDGRVDALWGVRRGSDRLYVNNHGPVNEPPQPPDEGFGGYYDGEHLNLQWGSGYDEQTDEKQLAYNLRVSTVSKEGPWNILSGAVGTTDSSGSFWGNIGRSTYVHLNVEPKTYFWQVQAINTAKKAGEWSEGQVVNTPPEGEWVASKPRELDFVLERDPLNYRDNNRYHVDVKFRIKDSEFNDCRISRFHYSTHPSGDWHLVDDESATLDGIWDDGAGDYYFYEALDEYDRVYDFLWKTGEHLGEGFKGDVQVKFTVSDIHGASTTVTSSDFFVDNRNPEKPGALIPTDKYDAESLTLKFSTPASDDNFSEYVIYYLDESSQWDDPWHYSDGDYYDDYITSQDYSPLGEEDFGGVSTITVSGLKADTVYHFALFAYDKYGNFSYSDTLSKKTNHPPEVEIVSVEQRRDGSGLADILFKGRDYDIEYSSYVYEGCSFWLGAGERREMTPAYEDERFDSEIFFTEEFSTYTFVWNAAEDIPDTEHASAVVELSFTDGRDESATGLSEAFVVDTRPPVLGGLYTEDPTASTIEWVWDGALDNNFDRYELWYSSAGAEYVSEDSYVLERDTSSARYIEIDDIDTHSYTAYGLESITDYWGCLWAFDEYGNINRTSTATERTGYPPENEYLSQPIQIKDGSGLVQAEVNVSDRDGDDVRLRVEYSTDYDPEEGGGSWERASIATEGSTQYGTALFGQPGDYQITNIDTLYESEKITNTVNFKWRTKDDLDGEYEENAALRITPNNGCSETPGIDGEKIFSEFFLVNNSRPVFYEMGSSTYSHRDSRLLIAFTGEAEKDENPRLCPDRTDSGGFILNDVREDPDTEQGFSLAELGGVSVSTAGAGSVLEFSLSDRQRNRIARWDSQLRKREYEAGNEPFLRILSSATADSHGNFSIDKPTVSFRNDLKWERDWTRPELSSATYTVIGGDIRLFLQFNEYMNIFKDEGMENPSVDLTGLAIQNSSSSPTRQKTFDAEDYEIVREDMDSERLIVDISRGEHDIIWNWQDEVNLFVSLSSSAITDLSGNMVKEIPENAAMHVETVISTAVPRAIYYKFNNEEYNAVENESEIEYREDYIERDSSVTFFFDQFIREDEAEESIALHQVEKPDGEKMDTGEWIEREEVIVENFSEEKFINGEQVLSSLTFVPRTDLPGNSLIRVRIQGNNIKTFADIEMPLNLVLFFRTTLVKDDFNRIVSKSGRTEVKIPRGGFSEDGRVNFTEGIPSQIPDDHRSPRELHRLVSAANSTEKKWEDEFHYPFEELTTEVIFKSTSGEIMDYIFEEFGTIVFNYSDLVCSTGYLSAHSGVPVKEETLRIYYLDENSQVWTPLSSSVDVEEKKVKAPLRHFSIYTVMGGKNYNLEDVHPYPVPYKPSERPSELEGTIRGGITFTNLPSECEIEIYTVSGRLVNSFRHSDAELQISGQPGKYSWYPVKNSSGRKVSSGVYLYKVSTENGVKTGKLMVIR